MPLHHRLPQESSALFSPSPDGMATGCSRMRRFISRGFLSSHETNIGVFVQTRLVLDTASRWVNSVPLRGFSSPSPFRTSLCTCELKISDLRGFICERELFAPSCPPPSLYSRCPSAFQGLCVFWRSENNNSRSSRAQISIYHQKLLTQVLQLDRK